MARHDFAYQAVLAEDTKKVESLIAYQTRIGAPLRAVVWSARRKAWIYAPAIAAAVLYDEEEQTRLMEVDRVVAAAMAQESLDTTLPTEPTLLSMCEEGERQGWDFGPPRS